MWSRGKQSPPQHISLTSAERQHQCQSPAGSTETSSTAGACVGTGFGPLGLDVKGNFVSYSLQSPQEATALRHIQVEVALSLSPDPFLELIQLCSRPEASSPVKICLEKYFKILKSKVTFPMPGLSLILDTALRRQGGAGGGQSCRMPLKLVA